MIAIFKNDFYRLLTKKSLIISLLVLIIGAIAAAIFFSTQTETMANIAVVTSSPQKSMDIPALKITTLTEAPPVSQMVSGHYDAILTEQPDGTFDIRTIKSQETKDAILQLMETGSLPETFHSDKRGVGTMIIGYLLMFLLMQGATLMCMFAEDKEHKQITRVISSPLSLGRYLAAHSIFSFFTLYLPTLAILGIINSAAPFDLGFTILQYAALLALICAFATAFALFLNSLTAKSDNANMTASAIIVMSTVLAGSFYSFEKGNTILENLIRFLPQKAYLNIVQQVEKGFLFSSYRSSLSYLGILLILFFILAAIKTKKDYVQSD